MILHLVRHGQSTWNLERRLQGQTPHVPLTPAGLAQARAAADRLSGHTLAAVWSSDLLRARQTAESIARDHGVEPVTDARLRDVALGRLEGASYDALVAEETPPGAHVAEVRWGGGESLADVAVRVRSLLGDLASTFGGDDEVVVVSHADTLKLLVTLINGGGHRDIDWDAPWATWPNGHLESRRWLPGPGPLSPPAGSRAGSPAR